VLLQVAPVGAPDEVVAQWSPLEPVMVQELTSVVFHPICTVLPWLTRSGLTAKFNVGLVPDGLHAPPEQPLAQFVTSVLVQLVLWWQTLLPLPAVHEELLQKLLSVQELLLSAHVLVVL